MWPALLQMFRSLDQVFESPGGHFRVHYAHRNPDSGAGRGLTGVVGTELVERYATALELTYDRFTTNAWPPPMAADGRIPAYVFHVPDLGFIGRDCPFAVPTPSGPALCLRSENGEPTRDAMLLRADAEATHELAHVFNHAYSPPGQPQTDPWYWFDEAMAVFAEQWVYPHNAEPRRFARHWVCRPDLPLELTDWPGGYVAGWFVAYLALRFTPAFLLEVWQDACTEGSTPLAAIAAALGRRGHPDFERFFAEHYCADAYFHAVLFPQVAARFGPRTVTHSHTVEAGPPWSREDDIPPLACRYYRLRAGAGVSWVHIRVTPIGEQPGRVFAATLDPNGTTGNRCAVVLQPEAGGGVAGEVAIPDAAVTLVVVNPAAADGPAGTTAAPRVRLEVSA